MTTSRLEAFSDGVIAIIITIMVLEIHIPGGSDISAWQGAIPKLLAYIFSFLVLAIYWNNHHHLVRASRRLTTGIMWANMHLLFWLSLIPIVTAWLGEEHNYAKAWPVLLYAVIGFMAGLAYYILSRSILKANPHSEIVRRIGKDKKGIFSQVMYILGILLAFPYPIASLAIIWLTALVWIIPDRRLAAEEEVD
jgi:uncharacterized membrane protein